MCLFPYFVGRGQWGARVNPSRVLVLPEEGPLFYIRPPGVVGDNDSVCGRQRRRSLRRSLVSGTRIKPLDGRQVYRRNEVFPWV